LRNLGGDLGGAIKSFRGAMKESEEKTTILDEKESSIEVKVESTTQQKTK
jgi:Sec-independent protein translocase protein TatA